MVNQRGAGETSESQLRLGYDELSMGHSMSETVLEKEAALEGSGEKLIRAVAYNQTTNATTEEALLRSNTQSLFRTGSAVVL